MTKEEIQSFDKKLKELKQQREEVRDLFNRILGAIEILENIKKEQDEKTD